MRFKRGVDESDGTDGINCGLPLFDLTWGFWVTCPHPPHSQGHIISGDDFQHLCWILHLPYSNFGKRDSLTVGKKLEFVTNLLSTVIACQPIYFSAPSTILDCLPYGLH